MCVRTEINQLQLIKHVANQSIIIRARLCKLVPAVNFKCAQRCWV